MRAFEFITEGNDREFHTGGSLGLPFPGTYEQEYGKFKRKGSRRITAMTNEALDSSYEYEGNPMDGKFNFTTEDGIFYKVYFQGNDLVEVAFSAILPGDENKFRPDKTTMTGTGNSRKVFGTVIKIIKEYLEFHRPNALYFTGEKDEPSRIKLYDRLMSQIDKELPEYVATKTIDLGSGKAYMLKRKDSGSFSESIEQLTLADVSYAEELNEIDGAHYSGKLNWIPSYKERCDIIGKTEGFDIYYMPVGNDKLFAILGDVGEMRSFIVVGYSKNFPDRMSIHRIENVSGEPGLATTLAAGLRNMGVKFVIDSDEPLTLEGLKWVTSLIKKKYAAFLVTDQHGSSIDPVDLTREREDALLTGNAGPTSILIEFSENVMRKLNMNNRQWLREGVEGMLKPYYLFYGADYLL